MKLLRTTLLMITIFSAGLTLSSCSGNNSAKTEQSKQGKEYTSAYICPMHCDGSGSHEAGECPVCGMDYKKNKNHKMEEAHEAHEGHDHSAESNTVIYACPMHPEITGIEGDKCSVCGMDLTFVEGEDHEGHNHDNHDEHNH